MPRGKKNAPTVSPAEFARAMNGAGKRRGRPPKARTPEDLAMESLEAENEERDALLGERPVDPPESLDVRLPVGVRNEITFLIRGKAPWLLQHGTRGMIEKSMAELEKIRKMKEEMGQKEQEEATVRRTKTVASIELPEKSTELATYPTADGRFWFPASAFGSAIIDAFQICQAVYVIPRGNGKKPIEKGAHLVLENSIRVEHTQSIILNAKTLKPFRAPENGGKPPYVMDIRTAVNSQAGRVLVFRPLWLNWAMFVRVSFDSAIHGPGVVKQGMELAGDRIGIGSLRPYPPPKSKNPNRGRGGPYGTFSVEVWDKKIPDECLPEF